MAMFSHYSKLSLFIAYIGVKFDYINEYLLNYTKYDNKCEIKQARKNIVLNAPQYRSSKTLSDKWMTWIVLHMHLELRKILLEINTIFGVQITISMGCYFGWITHLYIEMFNAMLITNYTNNKILYIILIVFWNFLYMMKLLSFNYVCESINSKANATKSLVHRVSYLTCNTEDRENILQLLLQITQGSVKFSGNGFFQFGLKFFYGLCASIATVVVLTVQSHINT